MHATLRPAHARAARSHARVLLVLAVGVPAIVGCEGAGFGYGDVRIWAVTDMTPLEPDASPQVDSEVFDPGTTTVRLAAAVNEVVAFQLVLAGSDRPARVRDITATDLSQAGRVIPAEHVRLYRQGWVTVEDYPAWYLRLTPYRRRVRAFPDVLIPLTAPRGALPIDIAAGRCQPVWVDVHVPAGTEPGVYRGRLDVADQARRVRGVELVVTVWPFALPQTCNLPVIAGIDAGTLLRRHHASAGGTSSPNRLTAGDPASDGAMSVLLDTCRLLHEYGCSPFVSDLPPGMGADEDGGAELDWTGYDRVAEALLDGSAFTDRVGVAAWPLPVNEREPPPDATGGSDTEAYGDALAAYLRQCAAHFAQRGWLDRQFTWIPLTDGARGDRYQRYQRVAGLAREVAPELRLLCTLTPQSMEPYGWRGDPYCDLTEWVDIWCPPARLADPSALALQRAEGRETWYVPGDPPYGPSLSLIAPPEHARSVAWQARRFGHDAIWLPVVDGWHEDGKPAPIGSERALLWPGDAYGLDQPVPSVRLARLRRGVQDCAYLWLLDRHGRPAMAELLLTGMVRFGGTQSYGEHFLDGRAGGWVTDPAAWVLARRVMGRELAAALKAARGGEGSPAVDRDEALALQVDWQRLTRAIRDVPVVVEGVQVRPRAAGDADGVELEAVVSIYNATTRAISGSLEFLDLPEGWEMAGPAARIRGLAPRQRSRQIVTARGASMVTNVDGVLPLQLALIDDGGAADAASRDTPRADVVAQGPARACWLRSRPTDEPIIIDGRLDDWSAARGNVASDFVLVGGRQVPKRDGPRPDRPTHLTTVFVCHDDEYLYVAFNCEEDRIGDRVMSRDTEVRYDGLWPTGEDLVEVLLDPTGEASDPVELLHVVVKANGAVVAERGVPCLAPVADHEAWAAGAIAAVDTPWPPRRWTVELRIPFDALGERAEVWGVNFARYHARLGEYASWSAAPAQLYTPVALGNLLLQQE